MVNKQAIFDHLGNLNGALSDLQRYKDDITSLDTFTAERDRQHMVLHAMLIAIQSAIDTANHIISEKRLKRPDSYRETFEILKNGGIIESTLSEKLSNLAGFRNLLVHVYWNLDLKTVFRLLHEDVWKLKDFERVIRDFLLREP